MFSSQRLRELFQISASNPELAHSQLRMFTSQVPLLYLMAIANIATTSYTHFDTAPRYLTVYGSGLLSLICVARLILWLRTRRQTMSTDQVVRRLKSTVALSGILTVLMLVWAASLLRYGDAYAQSQIVFFLAITAIGCTFCLMHVRPAALVMTIVGVAPGATFLLSTGRPTFVAMAIDWSLVSVAMVYIVLTHSRDFASMINFQKETLRLASENLRLANLDVLTELPNRRQFFANLHDLLSAAATDGRRFVVGVIDLDGFKSVNDVYGHAVGDEVLVETGRRLKDLFNESVSLARLGGDEFGILIDDDLSEGQIKAYGRRICEAVQAPFRLPTVTAQIACSIGFATYPEVGMTAELLFERADYALYHVKQHARGGSVIFSQEHEIQIRQFALVENCLRNADLEQELSIEFQPIVHVARGEVVAFEALARWDNPKLGRVAPGVFIPIAERTDYICQLTQTLLRKALASARGWPDDIRISFNLSVRDISSAEAILNIIAIVEDSGVLPERIDLEVTETALMHDFDKGYECLKALKALGVRISLDDFGSGYSSLSYVHRLPLDKIKIDRSFIDDIETQGRSRDIVKTIIDLCENLRIECIVEGLETKEHVEIVRGLGGEMMQGYYFAKPMHASGVPEFLATSARSSIKRARKSVAVAI